MADGLHSAILDAGFEPERWPSTLARVSRQFRGAKAFINHEALAKVGSGEIWAHSFDPAVYHNIPGEMWVPASNAGVAHMLRAPLGEVVDRRQFFDDGQLDRDPFTRQFILDGDIFHMALATVQRDRATMSAVVLAHPWRRAPFSRAERLHAGVVFRQIGQAMRIHRALRRAEAGRLGLAAALDRLAQGVVLADGGLRILHANLAAEEMLEAGDGVMRYAGRLRLSHPRLDAMLAEAARRLSGPVPDYAERALGVARPSGRADYTLVLLPALGDALSTLAPRAQLMAMISDPTQALAPLMPGRLMQLFPLTPAEARIASLAAQAMPLAEIAQRSGVTLNTVKSQLKATYAKVGVRNQTELVGVLMTRLR